MQWDTEMNAPRNFAGRAAVLRGSTGHRDRRAGTDQVWRAHLRAPRIVHNTYVVNDLKAKGRSSSRNCRTCRPAPR